MRRAKHYVKKYPAACCGVFYIISAILSYMSLRSETNMKLEWFADILFFFGMFVMVFVGVIIVFFAW